jgi:hypothetical protein
MTSSTTGKETMITKDLGIFAADKCPSAATDYQNDMFEVIRSEPGADLVELNFRPLTKTAPELTDLLGVTEEEQTAAAKHGRY